MDLKNKRDRDEFSAFTLNTLLDNINDLIFIKDVDLNYVTASKSFIEMSHWNGTLEELVGKNDFDIFDHELAARYRDDDKLVLSERLPIVRSVEPMPDDRGKKHYSSTSKFVICDDMGNAIGLCGIGRDVTLQIELEEEKERRELSSQLFDDILEADISRNMLVRLEGSCWPKDMGSIENVTFSSAIERVAESLIHCDYREEFIWRYNRDSLMNDYKDDRREFVHTCLMRLGDNADYRWIEFSSRIHYSRISNTLRLTSFLRDLDEEVKNKQELEMDARTDSLTGLLNRKSMTEKIDECMSGYGSDQVHALMFIDLDNFKSVNDSWGHPFGDVVLKVTAERLSSIFGSDNFVGRVGGDEFWIFLKNIGDCVNSNVTNDSYKNLIGLEADKIFKEINHRFSYMDSFFNECRGDTLVPFTDVHGNRSSILVTCSIGISIYNRKSKSLSKLYREADYAMYYAKNNGKNRVAFFDEA